MPPEPSSGARETGDGRHLFGVKYFCRSTSSLGLLTLLLALLARRLTVSLALGQVLRLALPLVALLPGRVPLVERLLSVRLRLVEHPSQPLGLLAQPGHVGRNVVLLPADLLRLVPVDWLTPPHRPIRPGLRAPLQPPRRSNAFVEDVLHTAHELAAAHRPAAPVVREAIPDPVPPEPPTPVRHDQAAVHVRARLVLVDARVRNQGPSAAAIATADSLDGGKGDDKIDGVAGADKLKGGDGNDSIDGGAGADTIEGGKGNDTIEGGTENDVAKGGAGDDTFVMKAAPAANFNNADNVYTAGASTVILGEVVDGGDGNDTLLFENLGATLTFSLERMELGLVDHDGDDADTDSTPQIMAYNHYFTVENVIGDEEQENNLTGNGKANRLVGGEMDDTLMGGEGNDTLEAGESVGTIGVDDDLDGDELTGGMGADTFVLGEKAGDTAGTQIMDFNARQGDQIDVSELGLSEDEVQALLADDISYSGMIGEVKAVIDLSDYDGGVVVVTLDSGVDLDLGDFTGMS